MKSNRETTLSVAARLAAEDAARKATEVELNAVRRVARRPAKSPRKSRPRPHGIVRRVDPYVPGTDRRRLPPEFLDPRPAR